MDKEVLYLIALCFLTFATGRLMVSNKERNIQLSGSLFILSALGFINYLTLYDHWLMASLTVATSYFFGFAGKDSVKRFLRQKARPWSKKTFGDLDKIPVLDEDEHRQNSI